ncbi:hypothetical protein ACFYXF_34655 [Streptomyces sp. NPDC002680]|uniref:hypothetical protein n=1 Tax=Streptomyces sp. NPDC002680 TaxID=3364659 RepID=UPI0036902DB8
MEQNRQAQIGDHILADAMRTTIRRSDIGVTLWRDGFELTGPYDTQLAMIPGAFDTAADLATFLGIPETDISDAR